MQSQRVHRMNKCKQQEQQQNQLRYPLQAIVLSTDSLFFAHEMNRAKINRNCNDIATYQIDLTWNNKVDQQDSKSDVRPNCCRLGDIH